jgi:hypothetical protein
MKTPAFASFLFSIAAEMLCFYAAPVPTPKMMYAAPACQF